MIVIEKMNFDKHVSNAFDPFVFLIQGSDSWPEFIWSDWNKLRDYAIQSYEIQNSDGQIKIEI